VHEDLPGLAADLAILDVRLDRSPAGIERDLDLLGTVRTADSRVEIDVRFVVVPLFFRRITAR